MRDDPTADVTLRARDLVRTFGKGEMKTTAVNHVSLDLRKGEIALLMGPSGSGKTTLLAILSGLLHPDAGKVVAMGEDLWDLSEKERERFRLKHCGFIFQGYNLFGSLTARQQLEMVVRWGEGGSRRDARRRADEVLKKLDLDKKGHLRPIELSGGEKQRVAIGRALIKEPTFIFADEPTSALDWAHGVEVIKLLQLAAHEHDATVLVVAHDERIVEYVDRVFRMDDGSLLPRKESLLAPNGLPAPVPGMAAGFPRVH
jgi:putative ABC transport system ATP-binding protein